MPLRFGRFLLMWLKELRKTPEIILGSPPSQKLFTYVAGRILTRG